MTNIVKYKLELSLKECIKECESSLMRIGQRDEKVYWKTYHTNDTKFKKLTVIFSLGICSNKSKPSRSILGNYRLYKSTSCQRYGRIREANDHHRFGLEF